MLVAASNCCMCDLFSRVYGQQALAQFREGRQLHPILTSCAGCRP